MLNRLSIRLPYEIAVARDNYITVSKAQQSHLPIRPCRVSQVEHRGSERKEIHCLTESDLTRISGNLCSTNTGQQHQLPPHSIFVVIDGSVNNKMYPSIFWLLILWNELRAAYSFTARPMLSIGQSTASRAEWLVQMQMQRHSVESSRRDALIPIMGSTIAAILSSVPLPIRAAETIGKSEYCNDSLCLGVWDGLLADCPHGGGSALRGLKGGAGCVCSQDDTPGIFSEPYVIFCLNPYYYDIA